MRMNRVFYHSDIKQSGFTLIEIVVALLVISIALGAVISTASSNVSTEAHLRDKMLALWVAQNTINEIIAEKKWPDTGRRIQTVVMNKKNWTVRSQISQTANINMRKLDVSVFSAPRFSDKADTSLASLSAYIQRADASRAINIR